jgi:hypothetical protein
MRLLCSSEYFRLVLPRYTVYHYGIRIASNYVVIWLISGPILVLTFMDCLCCWSPFVFRTKMNKTAMASSAIQKYDTYTFQSEPRAVRQNRPKYRDERGNRSVIGNLMNDPRVVRGNTFRRETLPTVSYHLSLFDDYVIMCVAL